MTDDGLSPQSTPSSVGGTPSFLLLMLLLLEQICTSVLRFCPMEHIIDVQDFRTPLVHQRPTNETHSELWSDGKMFFPLKAGNELGELMQENFYGPYLNFRTILEPKKYIWLDILRKSYWWPDHREVDIKKYYKSVADRRLGDMVSDQKAFAAHDENKRKDWLKEEYWKKMQEVIAKPEYKARSDRAKAARALAGLHMGGSIPTAEHFRRMCEEAAKAGLDTSTVDFSKIFERTHKRKKVGKLVDERATKAFEAYEKLESYASQAANQEGGTTGTSTPRMPTGKNDLWVQTVGRGKGGSVYGTGSLTSLPSIYSRALPTAQSTTGPAQTTSTGVLTMEQMTTMMFDFQRQLRHIMELVF